MKNKKIIYVIVGIIVLIAIIVIIAIASNKPMLIDSTPPEAQSIMEELKKKYPDKEYKKLNSGEFLNEDTPFSKYSFINNNSIYIFNPSKLDSGEFVYKKVYDIDNNIKIMNIAPNSGADIIFYDYNDTIYTLHDDNADKKIIDSYDMYLKANYSLSNYLKWEYSTEFLGKKIDYDFMSNYAYSKDNILYYKDYGNDKYPIIKKINGNYEGEKVIRIYNERIIKTDKGFYELIKYYDDDLNDYVVTTSKIKMLTKYYGEVLTFTYKYVILKDYTLIPINDAMDSRVGDYQDDYFLIGFNDKSEVRYEE